MAYKSLEVEGVGPVKLYKRRNSRSLSLKVSPTGQVSVSLPYWVPYQAAIQFALSKKDWIGQQKSKRQILIRDGQSVGKAHHIVFRTTDQLKITSRISGTEIIISIPHKHSSTDEEVQSIALKAISRALKKQADQLLSQRLAQLASKHKFKYASVSTRVLTSRWGSCDTKKHITLNIYLILLPWHLIDYVLIHELNHTNHMNHSSEFWATMQDYLPDYKKLKKEIKQYHPYSALNDLALAV